MRTNSCEALNQGLYVNVTNLSYISSPTSSPTTSSPSNDGSGMTWFTGLVKERHILFYREYFFLSF